MRRALSVFAAVVFMAVAFAPAAAALPAHFYWFENAASSKCMSAEGGVMANGTKVIQWDCLSAKDQQWYIDGYAIKNRKDPSFCLSVPNNWTSPGVQLQIWKCQNAPGQTWYATFSGPWVVFENYYSGRTIGVSGSSHENRAPVIQWEYTGNPDQVWYGRKYTST